MNKQDYFEALITSEPSTKQKIFFSAIFLFSQKGYANVGIRELCRSVNVKESAFYNHYDSKEDLFKKILSYFSEQSAQFVYTEDEIQAIVMTGDVRLFFEQNMQKFANAAGSQLYHTILQIVTMESFVRPEAREIALTNLYSMRREYTEKVLKGMMDKGCIRKCNIGLIVAEYYYALKGLLDEFLLIETWDGSVDLINEKIIQHINFFTQLLKNEL
jgi:AcrR family transcriptional regulator